MSDGTFSDVAAHIVMTCTSLIPNIKNDIKTKNKQTNKRKNKNKKTKQKKQKTNKQKTTTTTTKKKNKKKQKQTTRNVFVKHYALVTIRSSIQNAEVEKGQNSDKSNSKFTKVSSGHL